MPHRQPTVTDDRLQPEQTHDRYRGLFEHSPVSLWEEDYSSLKTYLDELTASGVSDLRVWFREHPDDLTRCASLVNVVDVNRATLDLLECDDKGKLLGPLPVFFRKSTYRLFLEELLALSAGKRVFEVDAVNHTLTGRQIAVRLRISVAPGYEHTWGKVFASVTDMTAFKQSEAELQRLAQFDSLTGLPNRATFNDRLRRETDRAGRRNGAVAVLMLDLDNFKDINDAYGHPVGDAFLIAVAERIRRSLRELDTVARLGGDEFAIIQTDTGQPESSGVLATRLIAAFEDPFQVEGYSLTAGASIGIAYSRTSEVDSKHMVRQADLALYAAKAQGRGTFRFHDDDMDREVHARLSLSRDLRTALQGGQFYLSFQPQVDIRTHAISGLEALLRWEHPERGLVPPDEFVPIAENNGLIVEIGEWVLRQSCRAISIMRRTKNPDLYVSVNISPVQMKRPDFSAEVLAMLEAEGLSPDALELELSERMLMHQNKWLSQSLETLHEAGVRFSVDDFGTAYSSMLYLRKFAVDKLKIARALMAEIETNPTDAGIVSALIALGGQLGLSVLAQGVERRSQLEFLAGTGCTEAQGYYFSAPASLAEIENLLEGRASSASTLPLEPMTTEGFITKLEEVRSQFRWCLVPDAGPAAERRVRPRLHLRAAPEATTDQALIDPVRALYYALLGNEPFGQPLSEVARSLGLDLSEAELLLAAANDTTWHGREGRRTPDPYLTRLRQRLIDVVLPQESTS